MRSKMKRIVLLAFFFATCCFGLGYAATTRFCTQHGNDIRKAQSCAACSIYDAHCAGGRLFRTTYVSSVWELAEKQVLYKNTYTDLSNVFRECLDRCDPPGVNILLSGWQETSQIFSEIYTDCAAKHGHLSAYYERGRICFDKGNYEGCVANLESFIGHGGSPKAFTPDMQCAQGEALIQVLKYDVAIDVLSDLIQKNPQNKQAYFQRAVAHFESGDYEAALSDYDSSGIRKQLATVKLKTSTEFADTFLSSLTSGAVDSVKEIIPCLWNTLRGIGTALWTCAQDPGASLNNFINCSHDAMVQTVLFMQSVDEAMLDDCIVELRMLADHYETLSDSERAELFGYALGKYGIDLLAAEVSIKGGTYLSKLRNANREVLLDTMRVSEANAEKIIAESAKHLASREQTISRFKIEWDKQNKHVPSAHNYDAKRSILTHPDAQGLVDKYGGKGVPTRNKNKFGEPGYREAVDFGEMIGYAVDRETKAKTATTIGEIHYSKKGVHIVPILFEFRK